MEEIKTRLAALETREHHLFLGLLPFVTSAARHPLACVASAARHPLAFVASAARHPLAATNLPTLTVPAVRHSSRLHANNYDDGDSSTPWSTLARRSRRETRRAPAHDAYLDVRVSKLRHRKRSFQRGNASSRRLLAFTLPREAYSGGR